MQNTTILFFLLMTCSIYGQTPLITGQNQKFVHFDTSAGLILTESLQPGMTLYSLSRKYNTSVDVILASNPDLNPNTVPLGYPVNIHVQAGKILFEPPAGQDDMIWLSYRVQPKETLYRISKIYLNADPEVIVALNPTAQSGLWIGQVLHIGWLSSSSADDTYADNGTIPDSIQFLPKDYIKEAHSVGETIHEQKGLAVWKPGNVTSHYYVLHPTAKLGSFMEITNPMLHRTITAKVAGHIPPGLYQSHVGIVVSPSTARALGVLDQQFFARWRYVE